MSESGYGRYLTFRDAHPAETAAWSAALLYFLKALTLKTGRPLILKSPPHTARIRLLLGLFPDARFIHIRRDPYVVFVSTVGLLKVVRPVFRLQRGPRRSMIEDVLRTYRTMYDAVLRRLFARASRPTRRSRLEELERDPIGQVRSIYDRLSLGSFGTFLPSLNSYLSSIAGYRKNSPPRARRRDSTEGRRGLVSELGRLGLSALTVWRLGRSGMALPIPPTPRVS